MSTLHRAQLFLESEQHEALAEIAEQEGIELWTADRRLTNGAQQAGAHRVHWIGEVATVE